MITEVTVEIYPWLSKALGVRHKVTLTEHISNQEPLQSFLKRLAVRHEGIGAMIYDLKHETLHEGIVIFVNNRPIAPDLMLLLKPGDHVAITPFYAGG